MASVMDSVLFHWGIPGMKWGIRRFQFQDGRLTDEGKKRYRKGKHLSEFSNEELDEFINRAKKEEQLVTSLRNIQDKTITSGKMFVDEFMKKAGSSLANDLAKNTAARIDKGVSRLFDTAEIQSNFNPLPEGLDDDEVLNRYHNGPLYTEGRRTFGGGKKDKK